MHLQRNLLSLDGHLMDFQFMDHMEAMEMIFTCALILVLIAVTV